MSDLRNYQSFKRLIQQADFNLKGESVIVAAHLIDWFNKLEPIFKKAPVIEEKEEVINEL